MKRIILAVFALLAVSVSAEAQTTQQSIDRALAAAPARARDETTVIMWNDDHSYETLKEGSNRMVCYDRSSDEGRPPFASQCTVLGNLERVAQSRKFAAEAADRDGVNAMVAAAEANGTRVPPVFGSPFISMNGRDEASAHTHHHRHAGCDHRELWLSRKWQIGCRLDHGRRDDHRPPDDSGHLSGSGLLAGRRL